MDLKDRLYGNGNKMALHRQSPNLVGLKLASQSRGMVPKLRAMTSASAPILAEGADKNSGKGNAAAILARSMKQSKQNKSITRKPQKLLQPLAMTKEHSMMYASPTKTSVPPPKPVFTSKPVLYSPTSDKQKNEQQSDATPPGVVSNVGYPTFIESLQLDANYEKEFQSGNFLYLRPKANLMNCTAYDLEIVEHYETMQDNYYTMSASGITHFLKGDPDFTFIEDWEREYRLFNMIRQIPFFRKYRIWKSFVEWKKTVRFDKIKLCSDALQKDLFLFIPALRDALLRLLVLCYDVGHLNLVNMEVDRTYALAEFVDEQQKNQDHMAKTLREFSDNVRNLMRTACDEMIDKFLQENNIVADVKMTFMERAALRTECRKLTKFLRLADFLVVDTLRALALDSFDHLLKVVSGGPTATITHADDSMKGKLERKEGETPIFAVEVSFDQDGNTIVSPDQEAFTNEMQQVISDSIVVISGPERVLGHEELSAYTMADSDDVDEADGDEQNLEHMVMADDHFKETTKKIQEGLKLSLEKTLEYTECFAEYKDIFFSNSQYVAEIEEIYSDVDLDDYAAAIKKYREQGGDFELIPHCADVGIILADSSKLKMRLMPSPVQCLLALKELLPRLMNDDSSSLLKDLGELLPIVTGHPGTVETFVKKTSTCKETADNLAAIKARYTKIGQMEDLMDEQEWPIPDNEKANKKLITEDLAELETAIEVAAGTLEEETKKWAKTIENNIVVLNKSVGSVREKLDNSLIATVDADMEQVISYLAKQETDLTDLKKQSEQQAYYQMVLQQPIAEYETLAEVMVDLNLKTRLWQGMKDWKRKTKDWVDSPFAQLDAAELEKEVAIYNKIGAQASKALPGNPVGATLKASVDEYKPLLPVIVDLRNLALKDRHWDTIHNLLGFQVRGVEGFTLGRMIELHVKNHSEEIQSISVAATQESVLEEMLAKVGSTWTDLDFELNPYKESKDMVVLGSTEDINTGLDDCLVSINTILGSRFVGPIRDEVEGWKHRLVLFQECMDEWLAVQRNWMYLETIFSAPDIQRQLPDASKKFFAIDKSFRDIMARTNDNPNALRAATAHGLKDQFANYNAVLDKIQKNLEDYLETKRMSFPRFYFLSNDELLEILAQTKNVQAVQPHLRKCFDNLIALDFGEDPKSIDIFAMISGEGERVPMGKNLKARGNVEDWLSSVEKDMKKSLHGCLKTSLLDFDEQARNQWVFMHPGQCVATSIQMTWARATEAALSADDVPTQMKAWYQQNLDELQELIVHIRGDLKKIDRKVICACVTTDVHARDIIDELLEAGIDTVTNFDWQKCLRYYWEGGEVDDCVILHSDSRTDYGYEYMGAASRLVITPMTDRCWMTITGSYGLKLGAAPAGPAGTGKTESSKDLAKAMAILCVVFNCSDQIDYKFMGKLFRGLAQCGLWTCLDEFNRIDIEVLSVIAQQMLVLREGRVAGKDNIVFMGVHIKLRDHHVIITMNPGYAGRTELPDNLQACFRPVSMMVPDYGLIAEIMLFAEGFGDAKTLSRKMCKLYILCSEQLSQQPHYDYGLRAVKSVLVMAGGLKRGNPELSEDVVLIRALVDSNQPKFLSFDIPLFQAIVQDLFPGVEVPPHDYGEFGVALLAELEKAGMQAVDAWIHKVMELFDIMQIRFGVSLVGPTGGGKSSNWKILQKLMTNLRNAGSENDSFQVVHAEILNPKCISMGELYGEFNELTQEWHDGLAPTIMRRHVADTGDDKKWTVWDGPIDALWIENMNTVLDDNMTLCLANGERIKLKIEMKMMFEVMDLAVASPATVSRIGIVYITPESLGWLPYIKSWLPREMSHVPEGTRAHILKLYEDHFGNVYNWTKKKLFEPIKTYPVQQATSHSCLFQAFFQEKHPCSLKGVDLSMEEAMLNKFATKLFVWCLIWTVGCTNLGGWEQFDEYFRDYMSDNGIAAGIPGLGLVYDYYLDHEEIEFEKWAKIVNPFEYNKDLPYFGLMVETVDTRRFSFVSEAFLGMAKGVFFTGLTGTGKTVVNQDLIRKLEPLPEEGGQGCVGMFVNFSAQTSSLVTQMSIEAKLEKKKKTLLGAPAGRKNVIFVDDVNMPFVEEYGAQMPIELLRMFLDLKGFYDRDKLYWKDVEDTTVFTAAAPPGGGRSEVTPRFVRHFVVVCMQKSTDQTMTQIFSSILGGFLDKMKFVDAVKNLCEGAVKATIEVFNRISEELLPTPLKSHYTFNLRDISKVFQGVLMVKSSKCQSPEVFKKLWIHESMRVFCDRLIDMQDQTWFEELICELQGRFFQTPTDHAAMFGDRENPLLFGDFLKPGLDMADKTYEFCPDMERVKTLLEDYLDEYNMTHASQMNLVFFTDAIAHCCRVARVLRQPRGNSMLVGVGGSGKQSLCRLAGSMSEMEVKMIELVRGYGINELREDIKEFMIKTGVGGKHTVWLFTDTQIVNDSFLEDINNILNAGEVPNLFPSDEQDKIIGDMRPVVKAMGLPETKDMCWQQFVLRVRDYLHIVLCMSPVGDNLRINCRQFPSLINCTTIDWFMAWPMTALVSVAERFLNKEHLELHDEEIRPGIIQMCGIVHTSVADTADRFFDELRRKTYTTPKSYLDLISVYLTMLGEKREIVMTNQSRMEIGVSKLIETEAIVTDLQADLEKLKPILKEKSAAAEVMLKQVAIDQADAAVVKENVGRVAAEVGAQAAEVSAVQADAQKDLDVAMPALNAAVKALDALSKGDITEVKSFAKPPPAVMLVMEAVCVLLGSKPNWDESKKLLGDSQFMDRLKTYDKDNIPAAVIKKLKKYVEDEAMQVEVVKKVSKAATSLCMWAHAMDVYSKVAKEVAPKKAKLEEMNGLLKAANDTLATKQAELKAVVDKVEELQKQCDATVAEKRALADQAQLTKDRLVRADKLTSGLAAEGIRWKATLETLTHQYVDLIGDTFLAGGFISYAGPFTDVYRGGLFELWEPKMRELKIPLSKKCTLNDVMGDPVVTRDWQLKGLGTDGVSIENAIMVTRGSRWPLMIDPQGQGNKWVKNMYEEAMECTSMTDPNLLRSLENCIRVGKALLVEDVHETLDPALEPILQKAVFKNGGRILIHLGDSDVDYDENFRFFMTSKMPNPHYLPEVYIKVTMINFTVTLSGLEDQLLVDTVKAERPDVAERQVTLMLSMAADKRKLQELQDNILKMLSESTGNILDDSVLIDTLADSKVTSEIIKERVQESEKTNEEILATQESYRTVATRAALLYFVIANMGNIDPMYQYSLEYYASLFNRCLRDAETNSKLAERLEILIDYTTKIMYNNICRGLFEKDKILYASLICFSIRMHSGQIEHAAFNLLMRGPGVVDREEQLECPDKDKLSEYVWDMIYAAETRVEKDDPDAAAPAEGGEEAPAKVKPYAGLQQHIVDNWAEWDEWSMSDDALGLLLPGGWQEKLDSFEYLVVIRVFREDLLLTALTTYVGAQMGDEFAEAPSAKMSDVYDDMDNATPCVFILSSGSDPTNMLLRFSKEMGFGERIGFVSLGQGQGPTAEAMINAGAKSGDWVLLQNCMLAKSWMPELEQICFRLKKTAEQNNESFRLFLTSSPATYFPVTILQNGVKMTNEPPKGFRAGIVKDFGTFAKEDEWETCKQRAEWKKLLFGMTFFSVMVQERRKFGPLGWNIRYGFNETDLETSVQCLRRFLTQQDEVPWDALTYVTGHINFGGRVTDDWDRRCLMSCLAVVLRPELLDNEFKFSASGIYYAPADGSIDDVKAYVSSLPMVDKPEIFGMHANANTIYNRDCTRVLMGDILGLQPRETGGGGGVSSDDQVTSLTELMEERTPADLLEEEAGATTFIMQPNGLLNSLAIVLTQEMVKFTRLQERMRSSCSDLKKAITGFIVMTGDLDEMYSSFMNNQLPGLWTKVSFATMKSLSSWIKDLNGRVDFFRDWLHKGQPATFPLPAFFFPQGFMTGTLQTFARKYMVPVNTLVFRFEVLDEEKEDIVEGPDDGVTCYGMYLEGAQFCKEEKVIKESDWGVIYTPMCLIHFLPEANYKPAATSYMCPVYKTAERKGVLSTTGMSTNFVVAVEMPTNDHPDKWVLAGMASLLNLTD